MLEYVSCCTEMVGDRQQRDRSLMSAQGRIVSQFWMEYEEKRWFFPNLLFIRFEKMLSFNEQAEVQVVTKRNYHLYGGVWTARVRLLRTQFSVCSYSKNWLNLKTLLKWKFCIRTKGFFLLLSTYVTPNHSQYSAIHFFGIACANKCFHSNGLKRKLAWDIAVCGERVGRH